MFSLELRVNTMLVGHLIGRNVSQVDGDLYRYELTYFSAEREGSMARATVEHRRIDGLAVLASKALAAVSGEIDE